MRASALWAAGAAAVIAAPARAQVSLQTEVSARQIEVGETVELVLTATLSSDGERATAPRLSAPAGFEVRGPSMSSQTRVSIIQGRMERSTGVKLTWALTPSRPGKFRVGPPSVELAGKRQQGTAVELEVLPAGSLPRRRPRPGFGFDPFDFFDPFGSRRFPGSLLDPSSDDFADDLPPAPKELALERPLDQHAFVRIVVSPEKPVVGQQVTFDIYAYTEGGRAQLAQPPSDPSRPDFLAYLDEDDTAEPVPVPIGDDVWIAQRLQRYALFPLKPGKLTIGSVEILFSGDRLRSRRPIERRSAPIELVVEEPPAAGRPPGYRLGDVGRYELSATVEPRAIQAGEAISVVARLEGVGNVPTKLFVPQQNGVEWLEPNIVSEVEPNSGIVRGFRTFTYVVKLTEPGEVALGELALPYWDPDARAYRTTRAELGKITVAAGQPTRSQPAAPESPLATLGKPRSTLAEFRPETQPLADRRGFWMFLFGAPLLVVCADGGVRLSRWLARRRAERSNDAGALSLKALAEARRLATSDAAAAMAQLERALFLALEAGAGVKARALLRNELERELARAGVDAKTTGELLELLAAGESSRFTGGAGAAPGDLVARGEVLVRSLLRHKRPRS